MFRLITWNVAGRKAKAPRQLLVLRSHQPDIVALQEVRISTLEVLRTGLMEQGLTHTIDSFALSPERFDRRGPRQYGQLIASRFPIQAIPPGEFPIPWTERVLSCWIAMEPHRLEFHTTHVPPGSGNGCIKIETFEGIYGRLARKADHPRLLCGDFNSPDIEFPDGRIKVFGERVRADGSIVPCTNHGQPPPRWSAGERSVITGLAEFGLPDVFRLLNGHASPEASWYSHRQGTITKRRFDHVFASPSLNPISARYLHEPREQLLSDHSALQVDFDTT